MKSIAIVVFFAWSSAWAQAPDSITPDTVVAHIGGRPVTAGEWMAFLQLKPPAAQKDPANSKTLMEELGFVRKLSELAEKAHLDQQDPWKRMLDLQRAYTMATAELQAAQDAIPIAAADQKKFYEDNIERYKKAKIKLLYVSFHDGAAPGPKKVLTEKEARAKIEKLLAQIRSGADFVKLVKENSEDPSAAKDGDFGTLIARSDKLLPPETMQAIFALKPGQVSEPVRMPAGYYLFRLEEFVVQPYQEVANDIFIEIRQGRFQKWREELQKSVEVKIENPDFFTKLSSTTAPKQ